jgi:prophage DNA circulation protein
MDEEEQQAEHQSTCTPCQQSLQGYEKVAQSMQAMARLLDDKALSLTNTFTEHLQYHRHLFASFGDMLDRKDQLLETITDKQHTIPRSVAAQIISAHRRPSSSPQLSPTLVYQHQRQLSNEQLDIVLQRVNIRFL